MSDFITEFLDAKAVEEGESYNTIQAYQNDLVQFMDYVACADCTDITKEDIIDFLNNLKNKGYSPKTLARKTSCIREFFKFLQKDKIIKNNPSIKISLPKIGKHLPIFLTEDEIEKLCATAKNSEHKYLKRMSVMIKLMFSSGLRVSELISLSENSVNYDLQQIYVYGKGSKERIVPVTKEVIKEIFDYLEYRNEFIEKGKKSNWLFPSIKSSDGHITRSSFAKNLKKVAVLAGISEEKIHPHVLRHSFATHLVNNDVNLRTIQKILGHESIVTTEIYTHITTEKLFKELNENHPLSEYKKDKK